MSNLRCLNGNRNVIHSEITAILKISPRGFSSNILNVCNRSQMKHATAMFYVCIGGVVIDLLVAMLLYFAVTFYRTLPPPHFHIYHTFTHADHCVTISSIQLFSSQVMHIQRHSSPKKWQKKCVFANAVKANTGPKWRSFEGQKTFQNILFWNDPFSQRKLQFAIHLHQ